MIPTVSMREALADDALLGTALPGESWFNWRVMLIAMMGEPLVTDAEREVFTRFTGRAESPAERVEEAAYIIGRSGGKDRAAAVCAAYIGGCCQHPELARGERGVVLLIAPDMRQAAVTLGYIEATSKPRRCLSKLIVGRTADVLSLGNGIDIEVRAASFRRLRGMTAVAIIASEAAFWSSDETSGNPDSEILAAARPALATTRGPTIIITSPYARKGEVFDLFRKHYGPHGDPLILIARGREPRFQSGLSERVVARAMERDPAAASAEYLGQFRTDVESFVSRDAVEAVVPLSVRERAPIPGVTYVAFCDPSGGSVDSMTMAVAHREGEIATLDCIRERRAPFAPDGVVKEFAETLKVYGVKQGDRRPIWRRLAGGSIWTPRHCLRAERQSEVGDLHRAAAGHQFAASRIARRATVGCAALRVGEAYVARGQGFDRPSAERP